MTSEQTSEAHAEDASKPEEKKEPPRKRPDRRRPTDFRAEAINFINAVAMHLKEQDKVLNTRELLNMRKYFRNYCANTGVRGKQRDSVWRAVSLLVSEAKQSVTDAEQEL